MRRTARLAATAALTSVAGCAGASGGPPAASVPATPSPARVATAGDTSGAAQLPVGFGSLRQSDLAVRVELVGGARVQLIPLDETYLRLLAPDSYRSLRAQRDSRRAALDSIAQRFRFPRYSVWYVSFFGQEQGEARFSPFEVIITSAGRDFRPLDIVPLTGGFGEQRLRQRDQQHAIYVFDGALDLNQPLEIAVETVRTSGWGEVLARAERERALVRSRAGRGSAAPASGPPP